MSKRLPQTLTAHEVRALMDAPNAGCPTGLRNLCMLRLMHRSGLRVSEVCGLHLRDIRWGEGTIHLRAEVAKGGREATAYLDERTEHLLEQWKRDRRRYAAGKPHLFTTLKGGPVDRRYVWSMVGRYARRAQIGKHVHPHMLRHTYATELLREGFNVREVQQLLRHADIRTTVIYTHIFEADLHRKIRGRE